jgi:3-dehydrosphinganine reductase
MLYGIDVSTYFPPTMYTPAYEAENLIKPPIVKVIEADDKGLTPDQAAAHCFYGNSKTFPGVFGALLIGS